MQIHHRNDDRYSDIPSLPCQFFVAWVHCLAAHVCICLQIYNNLSTSKKIFRCLVWVICTLQPFPALQLFHCHASFLLGNHQPGIEKQDTSTCKVAKHIGRGSREPFLSNRIWKTKTTTWKAKCPIFKPKVAGFRGKVAKKNRTLGVPGTHEFRQTCERPHSAFWCGQRTLVFQIHSEVWCLDGFWGLTRCLEA